MVMSSIFSWFQITSSNITTLDSKFKIINTNWYILIHVRFSFNDVNILNKKIWKYRLLMSILNIFLFNIQSNHALKQNLPVWKANYVYIQDI